MIFVHFLPSCRTRKEKVVPGHLKYLESELKMYSPEYEEEEGKSVKNPFTGTLDISIIPSDVQDEFLVLRNDSAAKALCVEISLNVF